MRSEDLCSLEYAERLSAEVHTLQSLQKVCRVGGQAEVARQPTPLTPVIPEKRGLLWSIPHYIPITSHNAWDF